LKDGDDESRHVHAELIRVKESLQAAANLMGDGLFADSVSRSYYAVFHAARACLYKLGYAPSTHKGVFVLFNQHLIHPGHFDRTFSQILKEEQSERWLGDYDSDEKFDRERAELQYQEAIRFVDAAKKFLKS